MLVLMGVAASGFVGLAAVVALFAFGGTSGAGDAKGALESADCTVQTVPAERSGNHVQEPPKRSEYNTWPPTNGPHFPAQAPFDVYDEPVEQYRLVHNLEHGGVVIQYGRQIPRDQVDELLAWYRDDPNGKVIAPMPALGNRIALAAWTANLSPTGEVENARGVLARCPRFDGGAFDAFMSAYAFKGPERYTKEQLLPGS